MSACDDDDGNPSRAVSTFQKMAPARPAKTRPIETALASMILAISLATFSGSTRKAAKFQKAAQITACTGVSTRVATTVAIELAVSWNPFTKSKTSAIATTRTTSSNGVDIDRSDQACLTAMASTTSLASWTALIARSMASTTSFHLRISSAS